MNSSVAGRSIKINLSVILFLLLFQQLPLRGQDSLFMAQWQSNGMKLQISARTGLGSATVPALEFPAGSNKFPLKKLNFWVTGIKNQNDTVAVARDIFTDSGSLYPGPLGTGIKAHLSPGEWPLHSAVSLAQCNNHKANWQKAGYTVPENILNWPSALNFSGFPVVCSPFVDYDKNGIYQPSKGDYPYLHGRENVFTLASDSAQLDPFRKNQTGLDIGINWFQPLQQDSVPNTVLFRLTLCNRLNDTLDKLKLSIVSDFAIGNPVDDQLATHVGLGSIYAYNQPGGDVIYGDTWPVVSAGWLSSQVSASIYFFPDNSAVQGKPRQSAEYFHYANGFWRSGKNMGSTGSGLDASTSSARFIYPGTTDTTLGKGRNWTNVEGNAGRQTALISTAPMQLNGIGCIVKDGFVSIIPNAPDSAKIENALKRIHTWYNRQNFTLNISKIKTNNRSFLFPNPVKNGEFLEIQNAGNLPYSFYDLSGKKIKTGVVNESKILINLPPGVYIFICGNSVPEKVVITY